MSRTLLVAFALVGCQGSTTTTTEEVPVAPLAAEYPLSGRAFPESAAFDAVTRTFFTSSLGRGDVTAVSADGAATTFVPADGESGRATVGLAVDEARRRLAVCAILVDGSAAGELWVFDVDTGEPQGVFSLDAVSPTASCTDVAFDSGGVAFVTDRENGALYRVDVDAGAVTLWTDHAALAPDLIGSNGIAFTPDGAFLLVSKYLSPELVRIRVADPTDAAVVSLRGDDFASGGLNGADDLVLVDGTAWVTLVDRVAEVVPDDETWASASVTTTPLDEGGVTGLVVAEGDLYGANGQAVEFTLGLPTAPFWLRRL
jgi:sugar lactone lactonase YvrE